MPTKKGGQRAAIAISKRRRSGEQIPMPPKGRYSEATRKRAMHDLAVGREQGRKQAPSAAARGRAQQGRGRARRRK